MDLKKEFEKIMAESTTIALATSVGDIPNVRILNFIYSADEKILYFQSEKGSQKEKEFIKNNNVAFTTIPSNDVVYVRVNEAIVKKSEKTIFDVQDTFAEKMPFYKDFIRQNGNTMDLYEIRLLKIMFFSNADEYEKIEL